VWENTTILSALQASLHTQFERLGRLAFDSIECEMTGYTHPIVLHRSMLQQSADPALQDDLLTLSRYADVESRALRQLIVEIDPSDMVDLQAHPVFREIYLRSPMGWDEIADRMAGLRERLAQGQSSELKGLSQEIRKAIDPLEVLYLPTYRRVEVPLARPQRERDQLYRRQREFRQVRRPTSGPRGGWEGIGIQFGLSDVQDRLSDLLFEIQKKSNLRYRSISANIIDELLAARIAPATFDERLLPDIESLQRFFSRIETHPNSSRGTAPTSQEKRLMAIQDLYQSGEIRSQDNATLRYFLTRLSRVVDETREVEANIEQFVERANVYLDQSSDAKRLQYDASRMKVVVKNLWTGEDVKMDDLSSGEKQVVSLLAHLYLYSKKKIVLIDEPELSLSIDWQKRLLPDVLESPTCAQLLAITHSPFIFDNELDPYAGPLSIHRRGR
jgi:hypothetical protein